MTDLGPQSEVDIYTWQLGLEYEIESHSDKLVNAVFKHSLDEDVDEARLVASNEYCIEWHITAGTLCVNHFRVYKTNQNLGQEIYTQIETELAVYSDKIDSIEMWIGTEQGTEKSKKFLLNCGFDTNAISSDYDEAYGKTFRARKEL